MENILSVKNLTVNFRTNKGTVHAVRNISFDLKRGETLAIVGESGSGKSVTSKAILGIESPNAIIESGSILYEKNDLLKFSEEQFNKIRGNKITMIFQDPLSALDPIVKIGPQLTEATILNGKTNQKLANRKLKIYLKEAYKKIELSEKDKQKSKILKYSFKKTVKTARKFYSDFFKFNPDAVCKDDYLVEASKLEESENILQLLGEDFSKEISQCISKSVFKITKKIAYNRAIKIMSEVGITEPEKRFCQYPFEFSGGMRQRIVIAIAIAANPEILICDEPTTALDVTIQAQILELIKKLKEERNMSVIFITHDLGVVANIADRVAVMYAGKIVEYGTTEEIFYDPKHPYTWALLSSMPDLESQDRLEAIPGTPPDMRFPQKGDAFAPRNKYAMAIDFEEEPPFFKVSDTHEAATWLLHENAPAFELPKKILELQEKHRSRKL